MLYPLSYWVKTFWLQNVTGFSGLFSVPILADRARYCARAGFKILFLLRLGALQVPIIDDVAAVEDRPGLMTGKHHLHPLRNARSNHVADGGAVESVEDPYTNPLILESRLPSFIKAFCPIRSVMIQENMRHKVDRMPSAVPTGHLIEFGYCPLPTCVLSALYPWPHPTTR